MKKLLSYVCVFMLMLGCMSYTGINIKATTGVVITSDEPTKIDMSLITDDVVIKSDGLYIGGAKEDASETKPNPKGYEFSGTSNNNTIKVEPGVKADIILNNYTSEIVTDKNHKKSNIDVTDATVNLILKGNNVLTYDNGVRADSIAANYGACVQKSGYDGKLVIKSFDGSNKPTLSCQGIGFHSGAIGNASAALYNNQEYVPNLNVNDFNYNYSGFGNVIFESGTITSRAGQHNPAIGNICVSYYYAKRGGEPEKAYTKDVYFTGAKVTAYGGTNCAGIGSGHGNPVDGIYISNGSNVTAYGGYRSPGIGSGGLINGWLNHDTMCLNVSNIKISGGDTIVTAYGDQGTNMPGIGCGYGGNGSTKGKLENVTATPDTNYQGYVKYGTSDSDFAYSTANPKTPFPNSEEFGEYLQGESDSGNPVYYTQVYFKSYKDNNNLSDVVEVSVNDTCSKTGGNAFTIDELRTICKLDGHDQNGNPIDPTSFTYDEDQLAKINENKTNGKVGDFPLDYTYTYVNAVGDEVSLKVTSIVSLRDNGTDLTVTKKGLSVAGNDGIHTTGGVAFTDSDLINLCDIKANDNQSRNVIKEVNGLLTYPGLEIDEAQKKAINDAKTNRETGDFPLTFTYTDPETNEKVTTTQTVSLRDYGTVDVNSGDPENGANVYVQKSDGETWTKDDVINITNPIAKDSNGNTITNLVANEEDIKAIIETRKNKGQGKFDVRYTYEDVNGSIVEFHGQVILYNEALPIIKSNDASISVTDAKKITGQEDIDKYLDPYVVDANEKKQEYTSVEPENPTDITNIQNGVEGTYKFTYKYTYEDLKNPGNYLTIEHVSYLTVENKTTITATDATVSVTESKKYTTLTDLINPMGGEVELEDGSKVVPDTVVCDDFDKIQSGVEGEYKVTFKYTDEFNKVHEITKTLTVTDKTVITANDTTMSSTNSKKLTNPTELVELMSGKVTLDDGTITTPSGVEVDPDDWKAIQEGKAGSYDIIFKTTNTKGEDVTVTKKLTITNKTVISANNINLTPEEGKDITSITDLIDKMNAIVTLDDGTIVKPDTVICNDFDKIKAGTPGIYQVTFNYTNENGETYSVIKTITIASNITITKTESNIKTGDDANIYPYIMLALTAMMIGLFLYRKKLKK